MLPNPKYLIPDKSFWAHIKFLSENLGYSDRGTSKLKSYTKEEVLKVMQLTGLETSHLTKNTIHDDTYLNTIVGYLNYRSKILETDVEKQLMTRDNAKEIFEDLKKTLKPKCKLPMNKQKGKKKHYAYLTCIINMLTEATLKKATFDQDPRSLAVITKNKIPLRTLTRRFDGAYPTMLNPLAIWEIKEYYGTTTFGSRVADGVYESILDGEELFELKQNEKIEVLHYLMVDDHFTWWIKGKSYLCRIIDMLHMGFITEAVFGREVLTRWPIIVESWKKINLPR